MEPEDYYQLALAEALRAYRVQAVADNTVCAVGVNIRNQQTVSFFSGKEGYQQLAMRRTLHDPQNDNHAQTVTNEITAFLSSDPGGGFTPEQINKRGFDDQHKRGAMNCAEPKLYNHVMCAMTAEPANWVLTAFKRVGGEVVYWAPCRNCRRWCYRHFHNFSSTIARDKGGQDAMEDANIPGGNAPPL